MQEQQDARVAETMFYFIVQWLSICDAGTAGCEGGGDHVLLYSSMVEYL